MTTIDDILDRPLDDLCDDPPLLSELARFVSIELEGGNTQTGTRFSPGWECVAWSVTLGFQGRTMRLPFYQGTGIREEPTAASVLSCLLMDASGVEASATFEDWAAELGYDADSLSGYRAFIASRRMTSRLRRLLGDYFEPFMLCENDE